MNARDEAAGDRRDLQHMHDVVELEVIELGRAGSRIKHVLQDQTADAQVTLRIVMGRLQLVSSRLELVRCGLVDLIRRAEARIAEGDRI